MFVLKSQLPIEVCTIARTCCVIVEAEESRKGIVHDAVQGCSLVTIGVWPRSERFVPRDTGVKVGDRSSLLDLL